MDLLQMATAHQCRCGKRDEAEPVLDARGMALVPGSALQLVAGHDPLPLPVQLRERTDAAVDVEYLQRAPQQWNLRLRRPA
jgi:uncharacterized protein (DUF2249 family)